MNIHVLMALAAFASVFMGNALEGGLLLVMFNLAHIGEELEFFLGVMDHDFDTVSKTQEDLSLCLVIFSAAEEFFTSRSMVDVKELKESNPDSALLIDVKNGNVPNMSDLAYKSVPVHSVGVGSYILVGTGEVCETILLAIIFTVLQS